MVGTARVSRQVGRSGDRGRAADLGGTWWQNTLTTEVSRVETMLRATFPDDRADLPALARRVCEQVEQTEAVLREYDRLGPLRRIGRGGTTYEAALSHVLQAGQDLLLLAPAPAVLAQVPTLRAGVRTYLGTGDPRHDDYARYCDRLLEQSGTPRRPSPRPATLGDTTLGDTTLGDTTLGDGTVGDGADGGSEDGAERAALPLPDGELDVQDRYVLREVKRAVDDARLSAQTSVRSYRNVLAVAVAVLCCCALTFPFGARWLSDDLLTIRRPLTASASPDAAAHAAAQAAATPSPTGVPASGTPSPDAPSGPGEDPSAGGETVFFAPASLGDIASVEAWGVIGGLVGAVVSLRRLRGSRDPAGLHLVQLAIKAPSGALTALFGVILLQSSILPQLTAVRDNQLAAYAVLFGFAQEALTRFVDRRSGEILDNARPPGTRGRATA